MSLRKDNEPGVKCQYRRKFLTMYDSLLKGEDLVSLYPNFWNELFLIKPNIQYIENEINRMSVEALLHCKENLNQLIRHCIKSLSDENAYRIVYSSLTLCSILFSLYKKINSDSKLLNIQDMTFGLSNNEESITKFIHHCNQFLSGDYSTNLKSLYIKILVIIVSGQDDINNNQFLDYIISSSLFESLIQLLRDTTSRSIHGYDVLLILTLLVNYRKNDTTNPFIVKLSILDDELALNGYGQVISSTLLTYCKHFTQIKPDIQASWFASLTNIIGNMFIDVDETQKICENNALLLALYEATHLNRNFVTTLAYTQNDTSLPMSTSTSVTASNQSLAGVPASDVVIQPFNLLAIFFQYCSIVILATRTDNIVYNVKLCFLILNCISEDQYANSLMHDANLAFRVQLHRIPMHHRKYNTTVSTSQPLAATLLDLIIEFITSHMMKKFPLDMYHQSIEILLKILCYQKRCRIRLNYQWIHLWTVLINLLKFLTSHESYLAKKMNIFSLATKVVNLLNIFVTYGDMFLLHPTTYDQLFYEIIRMKIVFINLNAMGVRYSSQDGYAYKESALKLTNALVNMRDILNHFPPKINEWLSKENISTPSEQQILAIITQNYDSLTLKLQDNLEQFERYSKSLNNSDFFNNLVKSIIASTRQSININSLDADAILQDYCNSQN